MITELLSPPHLSTIDVKIVTKVNDHIIIHNNIRTTVLKYSVHPGTTLLAVPEWRGDALAGVDYQSTYLM